MVRDAKKSLKKKIKQTRHKVQLMLNIMRILSHRAILAYEHIMRTKDDQKFSKYTVHIVCNHTHFNILRRYLSTISISFLYQYF